MNVNQELHSRSPTRSMQAVYNVIVWLPRKKKSKLSICPSSIFGIIRKLIVISIAINAGEGEGEENQE